MNLLPVLLGACFPWWGQICELGHDMTQCSAGSKWSPLTPLEPRCPGLFCSALSLVTWNMRCSQECPVLFLLHFVWILAAGHEELSDPGSLLSLFAEQGQCFAVLLETELLSARPNWMHDWKRLCSQEDSGINMHWSKKICVINTSQLLIVCCNLFCRSVSSARVRSVHCPPSENHRWWRVHLPLCVSPLQGWARQAWPATPRFGGAGLLQGQLQGSLFNVQSDCKQSPGFKWLHPWEEERRCQPDWASSLWGEFLPPPRHSGSLWCARNRCNQHL